ncbi:hypothetical protein [Helicobacter macacae]|uniref:hypothetical protein n=1 Tax=Helicobacter macacae TaxID=398626 RepID=UPI000423A55D|nr:hypothetical protein [Helicobacter macacae]
MQTIDYHENPCGFSRNDNKSPHPCGGDLGVGKSTQRTDSRNGGFMDYYDLTSSSLAMISFPRFCQYKRHPPPTPLRRGRGSFCSIYA